MRIHVHQTKSYDFVNVPSDVKVTNEDIASGKVRFGLHGEPRMRITKDGDTHTEIQIGEHQIIAKIIDDKTRPSGGRTLSRKQAVAMYISEHFAPHHFHRTWLTGKIEVHDDGPDEKLMREMLAPHVEAGNIEASEVEDHVKAYMEPASLEDHAAHMRSHFKVKVKS